MYQQRYQTDKRKQDCYICGSYKKRTADCTAHFIRTDLLTAGVLDNLRKVTAYAQKHEARFVKLLIQQNEMGGKRKQAAATKQLEQVQRRIAELSRYIKRLSFGNEYHARLAGSGTYSTQLGADVLGNLTRLSNLANGIEPSIEKTRNMQIQLEQQLASAEEEVKRPFPQATELTEKSKRLAVLEGLLNMNDKDIVTDTEPEQQCQTDNRQRGQEER